MACTRGGGYVFTPPNFYFRFRINITNLFVRIYKHNLSKNWMMNLKTVNFSCISKEMKEREREQLVFWLKRKSISCAITMHFKINLNEINIHLCVGCCVRTREMHCNEVTVSKRPLLLLLLYGVSTIFNWQTNINRCVQIVPRLTDCKNWRKKTCEINNRNLILGECVM